MIQPMPAPAAPAARPNRPVYLDNQATTPCDPGVVAAMLPWFTDHPGNPHSVEHAAGRQAAVAVDAARALVAAAIGAEPREIVFTSGATEANNLAIKGAARFAARYDTGPPIGPTIGPTIGYSPGGSARRRIVTVATEHKCVLDAVSDLAAEGFEPVFLPVGGDGLLDPDMLRRALAVPTLLVSVMTVNNETGVIQDIPALAALARGSGALFHTDAAQALGKVALDVAGIDLMSLSAHKVYGPKGVGALYVRRKPRVRLLPLFSGGGQERGLRPGTLPTPLIVGFGEACRLAAAALRQESDSIAVLRARLLDSLRRTVPGLRLNGSTARRIAGNLNLTFPRGDAQAMMRAAPDLCVSTGSACASAAIEPSYVLRAMGLPSDEAARTLRVGIGRFTSPADIDFAAASLAAAYQAAKHPIHAADPCLE